MFFFRNRIEALHFHPGCSHWADTGSPRLSAKLDNIDLLLMEFEATFR